MVYWEFGILVRLEKIALETMIPGQIPAVAANRKTIAGIYNTQCTIVNPVRLMPIIIIACFWNAVASRTTSHEQRTTILRTLV